MLNEVEGLSGRGMVGGLNEVERLSGRGMVGEQGPDSSISPGDDMPCRSGCRWEGDARVNGDWEGPVEETEPAACES